VGKTFLFTTATVVAAALGCGDNGPGPGPGPDAIIVESTQPAAGATGVEAGATVRAYFNEALNPSTVTGATFTLSSGGTSLTSQVTYDAANKAAALSGPLLPGTTYDATVLTGIQDAGGRPLAAAHAWSFTTRTWQPVAVDQTGVVGTFTSLAVDGSGRVHVSYEDDTNGDLKYATCAASCTTAASWHTVTVDQVGSVGQEGSLAVDGDGRVHVSYFDLTNGVLKYATCAASCTTATNWQTAVIDHSWNVGYHTSLAVDGSGQVHVSYWDATNADLKYATCAASCTTATSWQTVAVDQAGDVGDYSSLAVDGDGRVHVSYLDFTNSDLKYATCAASCTTATNWQTVPVDQSGGYDTSLGVDGNGRLHVSYLDPTNADLKYATCAASCTTATNWQTAVIDHSWNVGYHTSLAVDGSGRVHVSYQDQTNYDLKYATCAASCTIATSWQTAVVDDHRQSGLVGWYTSLAVDGNGAVHVSYFSGVLKYIR